MKPTALKRFAAGIAVVALMLGLATTGRASIVIEQVGPPVITGSWDLNFLASGDTFNTITGTIISGGAFETPGMRAIGWVLTTDTPTVATISGSATTFLPFTAHFTGTPPPAGALPPFVLTFDVFNIQDNQTTLVGETSLEWTGSSLVAVPETSTLLAGGLLLLPFGVSALRALRRSRSA